MKTSDIKIIEMLQAFAVKDVLKAFELYKLDIDNDLKATKKELQSFGWQVYDKPPENREFFLLNGEYWVQSEEMRQKQIDALLKKAKEKKVQERKERKRTKKKYTGQKMDLKYTDLKCPSCSAGMFKQSICSGCKEGAQGFKLRLICEENPDHEILL